MTPSVAAARIVATARDERRAFGRAAGVTARVVVVVVVARTLNFAMMPCEARRVEADGAARVASLTDRTGAPSGLPPKWSVFGLKYA